MEMLSEMEMAREIYLWRWAETEIVKGSWRYIGKAIKDSYPVYTPAPTYLRTDAHCANRRCRPLRSILRGNSIGVL
jgi:hypothetical protein